jgi:hypothetical protein
MQISNKDADWILSQISYTELTDWEDEFITSISNQRAQGKDLSEKQLAKLNSIWEKQS